MIGYEGGTGWEPSPFVIAERCSAPKGEEFLRPPPISRETAFAPRRDRVMVRP